MGRFGAVLVELTTFFFVTILLPGGCIKGEASLDLLCPDRDNVPEFHIVHMLVELYLL